MGFKPFKAVKKWGIPIAAGVGVGMATGNPLAGLEAGTATKSALSGGGSSGGSSGGGIGSALDWLGDNQWLIEIVTKLAIDNPELDYDKLMEMAIQEATINTPDVFTPSGYSTAEIDPETGKRTITTGYSEAVQPLFEMLVQNAGAPIDPYQAPDALGGRILDRYIKDRERHQKLTMPAEDYWDEDEE